MSQAMKVWKQRGHVKKHPVKERTASKRQKSVRGKTIDRELRTYYEHQRNGTPLIPPLIAFSEQARDSVIRWYAVVSRENVLLGKPFVLKMKSRFHITIL